MYSNNNDVKPMENIWEKWLKTWIMIYLGAPNDLEIGPLRPIFNTPLKKVAQIDMYTKTDTKPVEIFWENDQRPEFLLTLFWGPNLGPWGPVLSMSMWSIMENTLSGLVFMSHGNSTSNSRGTCILIHKSVSFELHRCMRPHGRFM